jgi:hypothetical protein
MTKPAYIVSNMPHVNLRRKGYFIGGKRDGETFDFYDAEEEYEFDGETYIYAGTEADYHIYELWEEE